MTITAEAPAGGVSPEETRAVPGGVPALADGAGPAAVRVFPGEPGQAGEACRRVRALAAHLGGTDPGDLALIVTEPFANAVLHTRSGSAGGKVTVAVTADGPGGHPLTRRAITGKGRETAGAVRRQS
jgi:anti-sigma regulatory factor (Ser/Thr protein kinase)